MLFRSALDSSVHLSSPRGERIVPFGEFMVGPKRNARAADEIISGVTVPCTNGYQGYAKVGVRNAMVISIASACLAVHDNKVRVALGSVGPTIINCRDACEWLSSRIDTSKATPSADVATEFAQRCAAEARPITDHRSTADYRRHAVSVIVRRLLERAFS